MEQIQVLLINKYLKIKKTIYLIKQELVDSELHKQILIRIKWIRIKTNKCKCVKQCLMGISWQN
jgi:hypothetical protein